MLHPRDHAAFPNYSWRKVERSPCHSPPRSRYRRTIVRMADKTGPPVLKGTLIVSISPKGQKAKIFLFYEVPSKMHFFKKSVDSYFQVGGPCQCWPSVVGYMGVCIYIYIHLMGSWTGNYIGNEYFRWCVGTFQPQMGWHTASPRRIMMMLCSWSWPTEHVYIATPKMETRNLT